MGDDTVGVNIWIAEDGLHRILLDAYITDEGYLRGVLRDFEVIFHLYPVCQRIADSELRSEKPQVLCGTPLTIVSSAGTKTSHITEMAKTSFQL